MELNKVTLDTFTESKNAVIDTVINLSKNFIKLIIYQ